VKAAWRENGVWHQESGGINRRQKAKNNKIGQQRKYVAKTGEQLAKYKAKENNRAVAGAQLRAVASSIKSNIVSSTASASSNENQRSVINQ